MERLRLDFPFYDVFSSGHYLQEMIYQENLKVCLRELSDEGFPRRAWLASSGPELSSFAELVAQTFDDTGLGDALDQGELRRNWMTQPFQL